MTVITTRPNSTIGNPFNVDPSEGAWGITDTTAHGATSDDTDATYLHRINTPMDIKLGFPAPTPATGAVFKETKVRLRARQAASVGEGTPLLKVKVANRPWQDTLITWGGFKTSTYFQEAAASNNEVWIYKSTYGGTEQVRIAEIYLDHVYVDQPQIVVDAPTGTLTTENRPTVEWTSTLDADGGSQTRFQVKIYDLALTPTPDPDVDTPVQESGLVVSAANSFRHEETLPDANYRVFVRIAQTVGTDATGQPTLHWSDWTSSDFTVDVALPGAPMLTLTAESAAARIRIDADETVGDPGANTHWFEFQTAPDAAGPWMPLRTSEPNGVITNPNPGGPGSVTVDDNEAPNGIVRHIRARAVTDHGGGLTVSSAWVIGSETWSSADWWVKHPTDSTLNRVVKPRSVPSESRDTGAIVHKVLGRADPVVVRDRRILPSGTIVLFGDTPAERDAIDALIDSGAVLLVQAPAGSGWPDRWVALVGDHDRERIVDSQSFDRRFESFTWQEVARPEDVLP